MAINDQGYLRPTYDELLAARIALAQELFGEDIDTSNSSSLGKFIRLSVQDAAAQYEENEISYYSHFPHTATGQSLDRLMPFASISRNPATRAEHEVKFTGETNYTIQVGFLVSTTEDEEFYLVNPVTLDENGEGTGVVQCTELGTVGNVPLGSITEIVNPDANVLTVVHTGVETLGEDTETDVELRARFDIALSGSGSGTASAIRGAVMRINGVGSCAVVENDTNSVDTAGRPAHSFEVYVHAPESLDQEIAEAIFSKKPVGIPTYGSVSNVVFDVAGNEKTIYFSRVAELAVHIKVTIAKDTHFEIDGVEQIKTALAEYVNGLNSGDDVIFANLYKHIFGVAGVKDVTSLSVSADGSTFKSENIKVGTNNIARLDVANITVEVTSYADV